MIAEKALARVPDGVIGDTDWVRQATEACVLHLEPAIAAGAPYQIANAVRAIAHAPSSHQLEAVVGAVCDAILAQAYADRNARMIANIADARPIIDEILADLRSRAQRAEIDGAHRRESVDAYLRLVALHDAGFSERLAATGELAARIAAALKLAPETILDVDLAGRLADIGLLSVPADVRHHTQIAETFVRTVPALLHLAPIVRSHHERYDGHGYADGLRGDEIPLESRIIAVAATFVDLVTGSAGVVVPPHEACAEILARSRSEFDPDVVSATLTLMRYRRRTNRSA